MKELLTFMLGISLCFAITACGGDDENDSIQDMGQKDTNEQSENGNSMLIKSIRQYSTDNLNRVTNSSTYEFTYNSRSQVNSMKKSTYTRYDDGSSTTAVTEMAFQYNSTSLIVDINEISEGKKQTVTFNLDSIQVTI